MTVFKGAYDHMRADNVKELELASRQGPVELHLMTEGEIPIQERLYLWSACRYIARVAAESSALSTQHSAIGNRQSAIGNRQSILVTGCFDWLHSGHIRFFEEASSLGELTVVVGSDRNVRLLKGAPHPMFPEEERRYLVASIRHVAQCLISTGEGWLDAAPEIERLKPDIYVVNEDGDKQEKRDYCEAHGIEYNVLSRVPAEGMPSRQSTNLRGF